MSAFLELPATWLMSSLEPFYSFEIMMCQRIMRAVRILFD